MKTKGIDPKANGLPKELERVKETVCRAKQIADKELAPKLNVGAAKRFVHAGLWEAKDAKTKNDVNTNNSTAIDTSKPPPNKRTRFDSEGEVEHVATVER